ncbi:hypothetical protein KFE94_00390 [bacterium SCSIO 12643]|nr:hypothetical protein KFE94_00390 [bacterium SCSIO 12643]
MKFNIILILGAFLFGGILHAQDVTTVEATSSDISDNLDLEAVASVFGESKDLEDFEKRLNDPETQISNLDLNEDGEVDYLRVVENSEKETHLITIQAVLGKDTFQDVATIDVEKDDKGETQVQVVGDVYMYGSNYIIEPVYVSPPVIYVWFWGPYYNPWRSPYYWGYYPPYYRPWHPYPPHRYRTNVHVHINVNHTYRHTTVRRSTTAVNIQNKNRRNDYGAKHPDKSFAKRNDGAKNRQDLKQSGANKKASGAPSTGKPVQKDWKTEAEKQGKKSNVKDGKVNVPQQKPANNQQNKQSKQPAKQPSQQPAKQPAQKQQSQPAQQKPAKPASQPSQKPAAKPAARPAGGGGRGGKKR